MPARARRYRLRWPTRSGGDRFTAFSAHVMKSGRRCRLAPESRLHARDPIARLRSPTQGRSRRPRSPSWWRRRAARSENSAYRLRRRGAGRRVPGRASRRRDRRGGGRRVPSRNLRRAQPPTRRRARYSSYAEAKTVPAGNEGLVGGGLWSRWSRVRVPSLTPSGTAAARSAWRS